MKSYYTNLQRDLGLEGRIANLIQQNIQTPAICAACVNVQVMCHGPALRTSATLAK
jgi:hypothetical protein